MDNKNIGQFLQGLRKRKGMTQLELANEFNVTHQTVSKWENGDSLPDITTLSQIAKYYNITIEEILEGKKINTVNEKKSIKDNKWLLARLIVSTVVLLSLFINYVSVTTKVGDIMPGFGDYDPFNLQDSMITVTITGFKIVFNANELSFFTGGAWLIFLSLIALLALFVVSIYSYKSKDNMYHIINKERYDLIKRIAEVTLFAGFILLFIGALFYNEVNLLIGFYVGLLFTLGLISINIIENRNQTL